MEGRKELHAVECPWCGMAPEGPQTFTDDKGNPYATVWCDNMWCPARPRVSAMNAEMALVQWNSWKEGEL